MRSNRQAKRGNHKQPESLDHDHARALGRTPDREEAWPWLGSAGEGRVQKPGRGSGVISSRSPEHDLGTVNVREPAESQVARNGSAGEGKVGGVGAAETSDADKTLLEFEMKPSRTMLCTRLSDQPDARMLALIEEGFQPTKSMASHQRRIRPPRPINGSGAAGAGSCSEGAQIARFAMPRSQR